MATTKWTIDPAHSEIQFKVKHLMITTVTGSFSRYEADIETEGDDFMTSKITARIFTDSVSTGNEQRDGHMKGADFFDSSVYPVMTFKATRYERVDNDGNYQLYGDLTIRDVTKPVQLAVEFGG